MVDSGDATRQPEDERVRLRGDDAVIVGRFGPDEGVLTDTYWGGRTKADASGHGHAVVDEHGRVHYLRESERDLPGSSRRERVQLDDRHQSQAEVDGARRRIEGRSDRSSQTRGRDRNRER